MSEKLRNEVKEQVTESWALPYERDFYLPEFQGGEFPQLYLISGGGPFSEKTSYSGGGTWEWGERSPEYDFESYTRDIGAVQIAGGHGLKTGESFILKNGDFNLLGQMELAITPVLQVTVENLSITVSRINRGTPSVELKIILTSEGRRFEKYGFWNVDQIIKYKT